MVQIPTPSKKKRRRRRKGLHPLIDKGVVYCTLVSILEFRFWISEDQLFSYWAVKLTYLRSIAQLGWNLRPALRLVFFKHEWDINFKKEANRSFFPVVNELQGHGGFHDLIKNWFWYLLPFSPLHSDRPPKLDSSINQYTPHQLPQDMEVLKKKQSSHKGCMNLISNQITFSHHFFSPYKVI